MKTTTFTIALAASALCIPAFGAPSKISEDVRVEFLEPENFTDFKTSSMGGERDRQALEKNFREEIVQIAERYLPPEYKLTLRFRDINMAGEYEPERGPNFGDVRIVRDIYPPSFLVDYVIIDQKGDVAASGTKRMSDLSFQNTVSFRRDQQLFYESELVRDLLREITRSI